MFAVGMVYLNPYRNEMSCCPVMELIYDAEYLEDTEVEHHFPNLSCGIIVFAYFQLKTLSVLSIPVFRRCRTKIEYKLNETRILPRDSKRSSLYVLHKLLTREYLRPVQIPARVFIPKSKCYLIFRYTVGIRQSLPDQTSQAWRKLTIQ